MPRALVIGGAGFIGSYVVKELQSNGYDVRVFDNLSTGSLTRLPAGISFIQGDIRTYDELKSVVESGDIVFHLAAFTSVPKSFEEPLLSGEINVHGTYNVFEAVREKGAVGVVFSSSAAVYGNQEGTVNENTTPSPESPYAFQKHIGEQIASLYSKSFNVPSCCLRYFNVYGKGNNEEGAYAPVTARFIKAKREGASLPIVGDGKQTRDFIHVEDVARANRLACEKLVSSKDSKIYNISSGKPFVINDIANMVGGEKTYIEARKEIKNSCGDSSKAKSELNWEPKIKLEEGIKNLLP